MRDSKMLIFGGTFDPIHTGHLLIASRIMEKYGFGKVYFLPSGTPPHKAQTYSSKEDRLTLLKLAIQDNPSFEVLDVEITKETPSYTIETIELLEKRFNYPKITFIMGADMFMTIESWRRVDDLLSKIDIIVASRAEPKMKELKKKLKKKYDMKIKFFSEIETNISSTYIREKIKMYESVKYLVPNVVENYILRNNLYLQNEDVLFSKMMSEASLNLSNKRLLHIEGVIRTALEIGAYHEIPFEKIRMAAGAHDIAKDYPIADCDAFIRENNIELDPRAKDDIRLMHGHIAAKMIENMYGIKDECIISAVKNHTFGRIGMSKLELLIAVADYVEPSREFEDEERMFADNIKEVAKTSLTDAYYIKLEDLVKRLSKNGEEIHPLTQETYNYYKTIFEQ